MSKRKASRKEKQAATAAKYAANQTKQAEPSKAKVKTKARTAAAQAVPARALTFGPEFYKWMGGGFLLVVIGMLLMTGGEMPSPDVWDEGIIYSFRRITLAPIIILAGLGVVTYAIIKK